MTDNHADPDADDDRAWTPISAEHAPVFADELAQELGPDHVLWGARFEVIARGPESDDILIQTDSPHGPLAVVHLTWSGHADLHPAFPATRFFASWDAWVAWDSGL